MQKGEILRFARKRTVHAAYAVLHVDTAERYQSKRPRKFECHVHVSVHANLSVVVI